MPLGALRFAREVVAGERHRTRGDGQGAGEHAQGGRLAGPVGPEQPQNLARREGDVHAVDGARAGVIAREPLRPELEIAFHEPLDNAGCRLATRP